MILQMKRSRGLTLMKPKMAPYRTPLREVNAIPIVNGETEERGDAPKDAYVSKFNYNINW